MPFSLHSLRKGRRMLVLTVAVFRSVRCVFLLWASRTAHLKSKAYEDDVNALLKDTVNVHK